uniref:Tetratricopeptide TPR_4 n=1 Tax=Caulobacter sp. (strain K31) TaxID=366602 RepID=B0SZB7_CAUSK
MRSLVLATALLVATLSAPAGVQARGLPLSVTSPVDQDTMSALAEAQADFAAQDYVSASKVLDRLTRSARFKDNSSAVQRAVWLMLASSASQTQDWPAARAAIDQATALPEANEDDWLARYDIARGGGDTAETLHSLAVIARRFPAALNRFSDNALFQWQHRAMGLADSENDAFELTDVLATTWTPRDPFIDRDSLRRVRIEGLLKRNRLDDALVSAREIDDPDTLIGMRADKRYDALTQAHPEVFDVKARNVARLARIDALLTAHPKRLSGQVARAKALLDLDRADEALAVADAAIARARADASAFEDTDEQLAWAINVQQTALNAVGRSDEAVEALEIAARVPEHGVANVSQTLNLSVVQLQAGRTRAALNTAKSVSAAGSSAYGRSVALWVIACATAQMGDLAASDLAIGQLRGLGADGVANLYVALTCRGDLDGAASLLIARLKDPARRYGALATLQVLPAAPHQNALDRRRDEQETLLRARPDVRAAIEAVGRVITYRPEDLWPARPSHAATGKSG